MAAVFSEKTHCAHPGQHQSAEHQSQTKLATSWWTQWSCGAAKETVISTGVGRDQIRAKRGVNVGLTLLTMFSGCVNKGIVCSQVAM